MPAVSLENVTKIYGGDTVALRDVSFEIPEGEFVVLLGPSGAGKSTMLRVLNGLTQPTEGEVIINQEPVRGERSEVGMVFQMHYLIESMSAFRNALTGALSRSHLAESALTMNDEADKRAALEALETVGLLEEAGQRAGSMSGGQKQRVGIARALVQDPDLLLADEPVSSLDPKAAKDVMRYMKEAAKERGLTTIASLHQVNIAREFGDRFLGVRDGELIFDGTREELTMDVVDRIYYGEEAAADGTTHATTAAPADAERGGSSVEAGTGAAPADGGDDE
ncbi:phosphonate ABC transporter ATP-binding protein [Halorussus sp. AFM4]|uniref:phosphonate ABC transporter ATP-binding protein n=1 Tax=Halorussus sp. AFM4 TaxID=3421651 RepID=UPI003EB74B84